MHADKTCYLSIEHKQYLRMFRLLTGESVCDHHVLLLTASGVSCLLNDTAVLDHACLLKLPANTRQAAAC